MQITRTNNAIRTQEVGTTTSTLPARSDEGDQATQDRVAGFFDPSGPSPDNQPPPSPLDLLFSGSPTPPGVQGDPFDPSAQQFSNIQPVTFQEWLMVHPEGRFFAEKYVTKMQTVIDKRFQRLLDSLNASLAQGGMTPQEMIAVQDRIKQVQDAINLAKLEIQKAQNFQVTLKQEFDQELVNGTDINGDGYVGDPNDPNNSFIVGHDPNDPTKIILLNPISHAPEADAYLNPNYTPALAVAYVPGEQETGNLKFAEHPESPRPNDDYTQYLQLNKSQHMTGQGYAESTFGAQIDISAPEFVWVEKGADGKALLVRDHYKIKPLEIVQREDGKKMFGQKPPTPEEKAKYVQVRVSKLDIYSEPANRKTNSGKQFDRNDGGYVFYKFQDQEGHIILNLRIEGFETTANSPLKTPDTNYVAATSVGIAVNAGSGKNSSRIRPMEVDASRFDSTGEVVQNPAGGTDAGKAARTKRFYDQLGIDASYNQTTGKFNNQDTSGGSNTQRGTDAANATLYDYFLSTGLSTTVTATYRSGGQGDQKYKTGLFVTGIRGIIKGVTKGNNIVVVPPPDEEWKKELLAFGAKDISPTDPAYGTTVDLGSGHNIVVSKGGDIFAKGVSFFWREPGQAGEQVVVSMNNKNKSDRDHSKNQSVFAYIGDSNADLVAVDNGSDASKWENKDEDENDEDKRLPDAEGRADDWFGVPGNTNFTNLAETNDLPNGFDGDSDGIASEAVAKDIEDAKGKIDKEVISKKPSQIGLDGDFKPVWGKQYEEWKKAADSFFGDWEYFKGDSSDEETADVTREGNAA